jgi:thiamine pyrophosphate-dependent acetolactate synthase large subunit-like protein
VVSPEVGSDPYLDRREVVAELVSSREDAGSGGDLIVTGLGSATYDVHAAADDDRNYYLWGAMGGAALVGFGLAIAQPARRVVVITGDGEQLMGMGSLATIAVAAPANLEIYVLDNEHYGETGMQVSHTGRGIDLAAVAAACGFAETGVVVSRGELDALIASRAGSHGAGTGDGDRHRGPKLFVVKVRADSPPRSLPPRDAVHIKNRLRAHLGFQPN